jgi:hypothetical protein
MPNDIILSNMAPAIGRILLYHLSLQQTNFRFFKTSTKNDKQKVNMYSMKTTKKIIYIIDKTHENRSASFTLLTNKFASKI